MRDQLRAAVAAIHIFFVFVVALPRAMVAPADLSKKEVKDWFAQRTEEVQSLGLDITQEELMETAVFWGGGYETVRKTFVKPANRYASGTGSQQSWRMFGSVPSESAYFFIEMRKGATWVPVYVARSDEAVWHRGFFDQERPRTFLNQFIRKKNRAGWKRFTRWLEHELQQDFPDVGRFRAGWQEVVFPEPEVLAETRELVEKERFWVTVMGPEVQK